MHPNADMETVQAQVEKKLETQGKQWRVKRDELKAAGRKKWGTFKDGIQDAWSDVQAAFKK
jgi:hypothetical protein